MWKHAQGFTAVSKFSSFSKAREGEPEITNPHGEKFDKHGRYRIDLSYIKPSQIFDLAQKKGQDLWGFSDPKGAGKRQVLYDVVRTSEVLIKGEIPAKALSKV